MSKKTLLSCTILLAGSIFILGCERNESLDGESSELFGRWVNSVARYPHAINLQPGGACRWTDEEGADPVDCTWTHRNNILSLTLEDGYSEMGETSIYRETESRTVAVVDNVLYMPARVRTSGSGEGLDGTWEYYFGDTDSESLGFMGEVLEESSTNSYSAVFDINGSDYSAQFVDGETGYEDEDGERRTFDHSDRWEEAGTIRLDGNDVYETTTSRNGQVIEEGSRHETLLGERIAPDVIVEEYSGFVRR